MKTKNKRSKNAGVGIDFKRAKLKVGKKLPKAQNATDTNFKAQSISLPGQNSLTDDRSGLAVSGRNLTLKDLLGQVGHYSEKVRKDALQGMSELFSKHPAELKSQAGLVVEGLAEHVADADTSVRAALKDLLKGIVLPGLGPAAIAPFLPLIMAHITSAMTHLAEAVRKDALQFLNIMMAAAPQQVIGTFLLPALQHYSHLLLPSQRSRSVKAGSLKSLVEVLEGLRTLLHQAASADLHNYHERPQVGAGTHTNPPASVRGRDFAETTLFAQRFEPPPRSLFTHLGQARTGTSFQQPAGLKQSSSDAGGDGKKEPAQLALGSLLKRLLEAWAECTPGQLSNAPDAAAVRCCEAILDCTSLLLDRLIPGDDQRWAAAIISKVAPHVPVSAPVVRVSPAVMEALVEINVSSAKLLTRFLTSSEAQASQHGNTVWMDRLLGFYEGMLRDGQVLPASSSIDQAPEQPAISANVYSNVLSGVRSALIFVDPQRRCSLLEAVNALASRVSARSAVTVACLQFRAFFLARPDIFYADPVSGLPLITEEEAAGWLRPLPRLLWELENKHPTTSLTALRMLHNAGRYARPDGPISAALQELQAQMTPLYVSAAMPVKASAGKVKKGSRQGPTQRVGEEQTSARLMPGPLVRLPHECQTLAVDIIYFYSSITEATLRMLALLCLSPLYPASLATRALGVLQRAAAIPSITPEAYLSLQLSLLTGRSSQLGPEQLDSSFERARDVVDAACQGLHTFPGGIGAALDCLAGAFLQELNRSGSLRCNYGSLQLVTAAAASSKTPSEVQAGLPQAIADSTPRLAVQYALGVQRSSAEICRATAAQQRGSMSVSPAGTVDSQQYPSKAYLALLAAAPSLLPRVFAELSAHADAAQPGASEPERQQRFVEATRILCEVFGEERLKSSLVGLQAEAGQVVAKLAKAGDPVHAGESSRLKTLFSTFYGLPVGAA